MPYASRRRPHFEYARRNLLAVARYAPARVGDRQRDAVTSFLALAHAEGFLSLAEHEHRAAKALAARTEDHLWVLIHDLPTSIRQWEPEPRPEASSWNGTHLVVIIAACFLAVLLLLLLAP
jgi:hypothetical protein